MMDETRARADLTGVPASGGVAAAGKGAGLQQQLQTELGAGEVLRWSQVADARRMKAAFAIWFFAIPWTAFALFWVKMAMMPLLAGGGQSSAGTRAIAIVFPLFGLPFIAIGVWMLAQPFVIMRRARDTIYGVTDRRLIRLYAGSGKQMDSIMIDQIGPITRKERADGSGDLKIQTHSSVTNRGQLRTATFDFTGIGDVAGVERLILSMHQGGATPSPA